MSAERQAAPPVLVWDPALRLFHWCLAAGATAAYFTREQHYEWHLVLGYLVLALLVFRLIWGFSGPHHARFSSFVASPALVLRYLRSMIHGAPTRYLGHNPAGGAIILLLLICLLAISFTGIALDAAENWSGPMAGYGLEKYLGLIQWWHLWLSHSTAALVLLHVLGVVYSSWLHGENLVLAMCTGFKSGSTGSRSR